MPQARKNTRQHRLEEHRKACQRFDERTAPKQMSHVISLGHFFETARKRCNSNVLNSMFEILAGELRATLLGNHADISTEEAADARNTSGATGKAKNQAAPA